MSTNLSRYGIAYDFKSSPFKAVVNYGKDDSIIYTFSSEFYKNNFLTKLENNRANINKSLSNRFGFTIKQDKIADLKLYTLIEKRGFLIEDNKERYECLSIIKLDGMTLILEN